MIARINGKEKTKQDLQVRIGEAMLRLGGEVLLGEQVLRLGKAKYDQEGSRARLGVETFS